ncbi:serine hydrolase domain-containing protein [Nonomuraea sp. NPDC049750]|uniref:serine hydrolase domain-containing protein n=1 Tax=Nonomuraea sp. NPDC049750 TaxID=3154738 RepID=UPI0034004089
MEKIFSLTRTARVIVGMATVAASVMAAPETSSAAIAPGHAEVQRALDRAVTEGGLPGILAEVRDGRRSWFGSAGVADTRTGRKRLPQERFRIGSASKAFTATVILQLSAEHRLSLDDTVEKWLPGVVKGNGNDGAEITIRQLLNHSSGIFNYGNDEEAFAKFVGPEFFKHRYEKYRPEQLVKIAMSHPPYFGPGQGFGYSNTNYILAGMIIERVTGRTLAGEISRRIVRPLALTGTYLPGDDTVIRGPHARHYSTLFVTGPDAKIYDVTEMNASTGWAAGGMVSTVRDLDRFVSALLRGRLLAPAERREMFTTVSTGGGWIPNTTYGLGVFSQKLSCGVTVWGVGGAISGSYSYAMGSRDGRRMVVSNVNGDWNNPIGTLTDVLQSEFCPADPA